MLLRIWPPAHGQGFQRTCKNWKILSTKSIKKLSAGDAKAGVQTIVFNLSNDEVVREKKGSKKVQLRNVIAAKLFENYVHMPEALTAGLDKLNAIPVDLAPQYPLAEKLAYGSN
ncbi:MAG: hypothetical protein ACE5HI_06410 [bacterium]